jgi:drug/metabolite transporter (DMT)-like permease
MTMVLGALLAFSASIFIAAFDFVSGLLTRRYSPFMVIGVTGLISAVIVGTIIISRGEPLLAMGSVAAGISAGVATLAAQAMYLLALSRGVIGVVGGISTAFVLVPLAYAIVTGDPPSIVGFLAIALIAVGIFFLTRPDPELCPNGLPRRTPKSVVWLAIGAALLTGTSILFIDNGSMADPNSTIFLTYAVTPVALGIAFVLRRRTAEEVTAPLRIPVVLFAVLGAATFAVLGDLCLAWSTTLTDVAISAVLTGLDPLVLAIFALVFLKQKLSGVQMVGLAVTLVGGIAATLG